MVWARPCLRLYGALTWRAKKAFGSGVAVCVDSGIAAWAMCSMTLVVPMTAISCVLACTLFLPVDGASCSREPGDARCDFCVLSSGVGALQAEEKARQEVRRGCCMLTASNGFAERRCIWIFVLCRL